MAEEKVVAPIIRRIVETTCFDPERGTYKCIEIRVEVPGAGIHSIYIPAEEYDPNKVPQYVKEWYEKYGKWIGKAVE